MFFEKRLLKNQDSSEGEICMDRNLYMTTGEFAAADGRFQTYVIPL